MGDGEGACTRVVYITSSKANGELKKKVLVSHVRSLTLLPYAKREPNRKGFAIFERARYHARGRERVQNRGTVH